ncbi:hypothetical protein FSP39_020486 [Pinctada imbricata]|uniref:CARD domain-containing protein n=1 Tax=Pinctada imbricata TaxID=66713 RepID=A0AA88YW73_PINIB|nr:hypothetical protein FSP39_020486 [Pinctada imbricata]
MEAKQRENIRQNYRQLLKEMSVETISDILFQLGVMTKQINETIRIPILRYDRARKRLDIIPRRGPLAFNAFCTALDRVGQNHLARLLEGQASTNDVKSEQPAESRDKYEELCCLHIDRSHSMELKIEGSQEVLYKQKLLSSFNLYAYEILNKLQDVIIEKGNGCVINHPSQSQHTCIMRSDVDNLELLFELAWENVKADNVIAKWEDEIQTLNIPQYFKDRFSQCLHCIAWRKSYVEKIANLRTQYELVEKMIKLEERFLF